jgi:hypothetical protein
MRLTCQEVPAALHDDRGVTQVFPNAIFLPPWAAAPS